jgi:hypothetical protein
VSFPDCGRTAAERESRGSGRRFWRNGFADGVWSSGVGDAPLEGNYDFGDFVYVDVDVVVDSGDENVRDWRWKHDSGTASVENDASPESDADTAAGNSAEVRASPGELDASATGAGTSKEVI